MSISACLPCTSSTTPSRPSAPTATRAARLDRPLWLRRGRRRARPARFRSGLETPDDLFERSESLGASGASLARVQADRRPARGLLRQLGGPRLQSLHDAVDLAPAFSQLVVELGIQTATVGVLALANRLLAGPERPFGIDERRPLPGDRPPFGFEPSQVIVHARQMLGQLLFAIAEILPRDGDHARRHSEPRGDLDGQTASRAIRRAGDRSGQTSPD